MRSMQEMVRRPVLLALVVVAPGATACRPTAASDGGSYLAPDADSIRAANNRHTRTTATDVVQVTDEDRSRYARIELLIQARFAGVQVHPSADGYSISIRGKSTLNANNGEPLIVVDGIIAGPGQLAQMNPNDVDRIAIIKDGSAAFYGARGGNGVIEITTRRAPR